MTDRIHYWMIATRMKFWMGVRYVADTRYHRAQDKHVEIVGREKRRRSMLNIITRV